VGSLLGLWEQLRWVFRQGRAIPSKAGASGLRKDASVNRAAFPPLIMGKFEIWQRVLPAPVRRRENARPCSAAPVEVL
jgi:hypothetical protein